MIKSASKEIPEIRGHIDYMLKNITRYMSMLRLLIRDSDHGIEFYAPGEIHQNTMTPIHQMVLNNYTSCVGGSQNEILECGQHLHYRSFSGICNNLEQPIWGASMNAFIRLLPPIYEDNLLKPVGWFLDFKYAGGFHKPNPKQITAKLLSSTEVTNDEDHNHMLMQFGQFLDHDITFAVQARNLNLLEDDLLDCRRTCDYIEPCFSLKPLQNQEGLFEFEKCIEVVRSAEFCGTGYTSIIFGKLSHREQANQLTAFIDGSNIYGNTPEMAQYIRRINSAQGLLKTLTFNNKDYLPIDFELNSMDCKLNPKINFTDCFLAGDHRANEQIGLLVFHNLWLRHHNQLAVKMRYLFHKIAMIITNFFSALHPDWNGTHVYHEARKIIGAQLQIITYRDWLPLVVGSKVGFN